MQITQITVNNLFDNFQHTIHMRILDHITIMLSPNGFGKTSLLRMVSGLFNSNYSVLRNIPFSEFKISFNDNSQLIIEKESKLKKKKTSSELIFKLKKEGGPLQHYTIPSMRDLDDLYPVANYVESTVSGLVRTSGNTWRYLPTDEELTIEDVVDKFADMLPSNRLSGMEREPAWLKEIKSSLDVRLIETQRLLRRKGRRSRDYVTHSEPNMVPSVTLYSDDLVANIKTNLANYASLSQSLDRTFPMRLVTQQHSNPLTSEELNRKLRELENKRQKFIEVGLLDKSNDDFRVPSSIEDNQRNVLSVYVTDVEQKLSVLDEIAKKNDLLRDIITRRFQYKKFTISKEKGFDFKTHKEVPLSVIDLSSGEQHELVLLYELLFNMKSNSLILIDEPELSLHVGWQMEFLQDLKSIVSLTEFDVLIATHSPQIISDRWDLCEELKGPEV